MGILCIIEGGWILKGLLFWDKSPLTLSFIFSAQTRAIRDKDHILAKCCSKQNDKRNPQQIVKLSVYLVKENYSKRHVVKNAEGKRTHVGLSG